MSAPVEDIQLYRFTDQVEGVDDNWFYLRSTAPLDVDHDLPLPDALKTPTPSAADHDQPLPDGLKTPTPSAVASVEAEANVAHLLPPLTLRVPGGFMAIESETKVTPPAKRAAAGTNPARSSIDELAKKIASQAPPDPGKHAHLTIFVHGYGTSENSELNGIKRTRGQMSDFCHTARFRVGYRWPSEMPLKPLATSIQSMTLLLGILLAVATLAIAARFRTLVVNVPGLGFIRHHPSLCWIFLGLWLAFVLLRASVYFRDSYRAINYGVEDLVEFIRRLDLKLFDELKNRKAGRVELSFVGHSMGGLVVTNVIRILSDVFDPLSIRTSSTGTENAQSATSDGKHSLSDLGSSFTLRRFVLVSPDIPALAVVSGRANFLRAAIRRCSEAFLFSNGGDVVLSLISRSANYVQFPARFAASSARLGNLQLASPIDTEFKPTSLVSLREHIRFGKRTLATLDENFVQGVNAPDDQEDISRFNLFDCTAYKAGNRMPLSNISSAKPPSALTQLRGLGSYFLAVATSGWIRIGKDCHSGYFEERGLARLIFHTAESGKCNVEPYLKDTKGLRYCWAFDSDTPIPTPGPLGRLGDRDATNSSNP